MEDWDRKEKDNTNDSFKDILHRFCIDVVYDSQLTPYLIRGAFAKFKPRTYGIMLILFGGMSDDYIKNIMHKTIDEGKGSTNTSQKESTK